MEKTVQAGKKITIPFDGVLVPEERYRWYNRQVSENEMLQLKVEELDIAPSNDGTIYYVLGGFVVGVFAGYIVSHK